jgi:tRNA (mo5U34)-methyltransferase
VRSASSLDISEIIQRAIAFQERMDSVKAQIRPREFKWYPYDAWTNIVPLDELLKGERRQLLDLIGDNPVLDIGCADGLLSFFLESMGCTVHAIDYPPTNHNDMRGVRALKAALQSSIAIHEIDLDSQFRLPHDRYGLVFFLGILYHLKNPFYALETLARHAQYLILSTRVARFSPDKRIDYHRAPMAYLLGEREANNDPTNYWIFSHAGLRRLIQRTGWEICGYRTAGNTRDSDPATWEGDERAFCLLKSRVLGEKWNASLLKGWHQVEHGSWRWTERQFSVSLRLPVRGEPATVHLRFALPQPLIERLGAITIQAAANGVALDAETYHEPGEFAYIQTIPAAAATGDLALVDFTLDRALPPDETDNRERGIVVSFIGIE